MIQCVILFILNLLIHCDGQAHITPLDARPFISQFRNFRDLALNLLGDIGDNGHKIKVNHNNSVHYTTPKKDCLYGSIPQRLQPQFPEDLPFFCNISGMRSSEVPSSVDKLRPGDIDIVGAIGDSLTAGNGAMATNLLEVIVESKGLSWCVGGQGTWREFLTLPNILKEFNPNLYGFPEKDSVATEKSSRFNIAETGAMSQDIPNMAKNLVKRMLSDPKADVENHWKLITIMIGSNDFCSNICYLDPPDKALVYHEQNLLEVLRIFRDHLPRTLVNLVATPNVNILTQLKGKPRRCEVLHLLECPCFLGARFAGQRQRFVQIIERWNALQANIANREEFHTKSDFGVVWQPCLANISFPTNQNGDSDFSYMSYDCFHLSQKGYARAANGLWNNMIEPVGQKAHDWVDEFSVFKCPTPEMPFIRTRGNSNIK